MQDIVVKCPVCKRNMPLTSILCSMACKKRFNEIREEGILKMWLNINPKSENEEIDYKKLTNK